MSASIANAPLGVKADAVALVLSSGLPVAQVAPEIGVVEGTMSDNSAAGHRIRGLVLRERVILTIYPDQKDILCLTHR